MWSWAYFPTGTRLRCKGLVLESMFRMGKTSFQPTNESKLVYLRWERHHQSFEQGCVSMPMKKYVCSFLLKFWYVCTYNVDTYIHPYVCMYNKISATQNICKKTAKKHCDLFSWIVCKDFIVNRPRIKNIYSEFRNVSNTWKLFLLMYLLCQIAEQYYTHETCLILYNYIVFEVLCCFW